VALGPELIRLPNGVRLALDPMASLETVGVGAWIKVGARWESPEENGVAHLFEHMAFKGGGKRDARQLVEAIEAVGGYMNAATSYERTSYYARALGRDAAFALDLIADVILEPHWEDDELEKEKNVVAQERGEARDQPDDRVFELHQAAAFPDQPLGRPVLGLEETLARINVKTLEAFRAAHYAPARTVIAVAGQFDRAAILDLVARRFGAAPAIADIPAAPAQAKGGALIEDRKLEQLHLALSWPGPAAGAEALYAARLLAEIYGGGMASRLFQDVREERGLVYQIDSYLDPYEDVGRFGVYAACAGANTGEVIARSVDILQDLAARGPTEAEAARAKAVVTAQMLMGAETPMARAETRASQVLLHDKVIDLAAIRAKVEAVSREAIQEIARQAVAGPAVASAIGPKAGLRAVEAVPALFAPVIPGRA
jgi:predicted Zn-dependent peptidase